MAARQPSKEGAQPAKTSTQDHTVAPLLRAAAQGDQSAWDELISRYARRVYAMIKSNCKDHHLAEEITQSTFVTIAQKLPEGRYTEQNAFEPWLFLIAMNRLRDHMRKRKRRGEQLLGDRDNDTQRPGMSTPQGTQAIDPAQRSLLHEAMDQLSNEDRIIIELRHHAELSFPQIASLQEKPLGTVLAKHHRALKKLRVIMQSTPDT